MPLTKFSRPFRMHTFPSDATGDKFSLICYENVMKMLRKWFIFLLLGSLLPFCLDRDGKKHSAYKCSRPRFGCARCIWMYVAVHYLPQLVIGFCSLLSHSLAFAVPTYAFYLENKSNWPLTSHIELKKTSICEADWPKKLINFFYFAFFNHLESGIILIEIFHLI